MENGDENQPNGQRLRPNVQFFARLMKNTNSWNTKLLEEENAAAEEKLRARERFLLI